MSPWHRTLIDTAQTLLISLTPERSTSCWSLRRPQRGSHTAGAQQIRSNESTSSEPGSARNYPSHGPGARPGKGETDRGEAGRARGASPVPARPGISNAALGPPRRVLAWQREAADTARPPRTALRSNIAGGRAHRARALQPQSRPTRERRPPWPIAAGQDAAPPQLARGRAQEAEVASMGRGRAREEVAAAPNAGVQMAGGGCRTAISAASTGPGRPGRPQGRRQQQLQGKQRSAPWPKPRRWVSLPRSFCPDLSLGQALSVRWARWRVSDERRCEGVSRVTLATFQGAVFAILDEVRERRFPLGFSECPSRQPHRVLREPVSGTACDEDAPLIREHHSSQSGPRSFFSHAQLQFL